jgi:hypothetical protein
MSYGDGLVQYGPELAAVQVETAAADIKSYVLPYPVTVLGFGVIITETFAAHATDPVVSLDFKDKDTARTEIVALTLNSALKRSDGSRVAQTALAVDSDIVLDDVVLVKGISLPKRLQPGTTLFLEAKVAAGEAGGAYIPVVLARVEGYDLQNDAILS